MAHTDEKLCLTAGAVLVRDDKVLLFNHPRYNLWLPVGGHIDKGEDPIETVYREIKEESGYDASEIELYGTTPSIGEESNDGSFLITPAYMDRHPAADREHVALVYFAKVLTGRDPLQSEEHSDMRWFAAQNQVR